MKKMFLKMMVIIPLFSVFIASCDSEKEPSVITNENYTWNFTEKNAYKGNFDFTIESELEKREFELTLDDNVIEPLKYTNGNVTIMYDLDDNYPCHSDTIEHAYNEITFNNNVLGKLPSDNSSGVNVDISNLAYGTNVFSITIGQVYVNNKKYDTNSIHGGLNGAGDDFKLANVRLVSPAGKVIKPTKMIVYKPKNAYSSEYVTYEIQQIDDEFYFIGDGWGGSLSYDGNSNPRLDIPFKIDYYFDYTLPLFAKTYNLNTLNYLDGLHVLTLKDKGKVVLKNNIYIDNSKPIVYINVKDNDYINKSFKIECGVSDLVTQLVEKQILIDGKEVLLNPMKIEDITLSMNFYDIGHHNITLYGKDLAGNEVYENVNFIITKQSQVVDYEITDNQISVNAKYTDVFTSNIYKANVLKFDTENIVNTSTSNPSNNISSFNVLVEDINKEVYISYVGESYEGERLSIELYNPNTSAYERILIANANEEVNFKINPKIYMVDNYLKFNVSPIYTENGSNKIIWSSDTQYLPKIEFTDINYMYNSLMEYIKVEYENNNIAYMIHTGDIVDNPPSYGEKALAEWKNASEAFKVLDEGNIPYGVLAGNHDVGSELVNINYDYYSTYFGVDRYNKSDYFGGSLNNNECHYDLITIGQYDFVVLYIGFGIEWKKQTIQWANKILKKYSHRNAIVATHGYLLADGTIDPETQGQIIYDEIVMPNDNVKFVLCGHNDGTAKVKKQINENRYVYELLNCYQFVETKKYSVSHKINGMTCNGEAFIKSLTFNPLDNEKCEVSCLTYSPVINSYQQPFGNDNYKIEVDLIASNRYLITKQFKAYQSIGDSLSNFNTSTYQYSFKENENYIVVSGNDKSYGILLI